MAQTVVSLRFEIDPVHDCVGHLLRIHQALTKRHGARFRDLERLIETALEGPATDIGTVTLEPGLVVMTPPPSWIRLIAEAKALGVI